MKLKNYRLGLIVLSASLLSGTAWAATITVGPSGADHTTIQAAINAATAGDEIQIAAGTYVGPVTVNKDVDLIGAGIGLTLVNSTGNVISITTAGSGSNITGISVTGGSRGINISNASDLVIDGVEVDSHTSYGVNFDGANSNVTLKNSSFSNNGSAGVKVASTARVNGLNIESCELNGNLHGLYAADGSAATYMANAQLNGITVTGSTFNNNSNKGIYIESMNDGMFDGIEVVNSGQGATGATAAGIDINLKYSNYSNLTIRNSLVSGCGQNYSFGGGILIKARSTGTYSANPATLGGTILLEGLTVENNGGPGGGAGIRVGDAAGETSPSNVVVTESTFDGNGEYAVYNLLSSESVDASLNYWGSAALPSTPADYIGNVVVLPYYKDAAFASVGPVRVGSTGYATIQSAISSPTTNPGDTVEVDPGVYQENVVVDKSVSILGPNAGIPGNGVRSAEAIVHPAVSAVNSGEVFHVTASNVTIDGLTIDGDNPTLTSGYLGTNGADLDAAEAVGVYVDNVNNLDVSHNIIRNLSYFGVSFFGAAYSAPASSGHLVSENLIEHLGTYDAGSNIAKWGGGVLLYNSQFARVEDNVMQNVRIGVQTGNFHRANPGAAASQVITGNAIQARRLGIFHNLHTALSSPLTLSNNSITALGHPEEVLVKGILLASLSTPSFSQDNLIDLSAATTPSIGYEVWNVKSTSPASIVGGVVTAATTGLFLNNFEGYNTNAGDGAHSAVSGLAISPTAAGTGIRVLDSPASTSHAPVQLELGTGVSVSGGTNGLVIEGANASQSTISDLVLSGQSGNYIELIDNAGNVDATGVAFDGKLGSAMDLGELFAVEAKVVHQYDNPALGLVTWNATFNPANVVIDDTQIAGDLTIPAGTTVTVTPTGSLTTDKLDVEDGAELVVNEGDLAIGEDTVISGTFTIFNSFGSWNINGNTTFNIGQSLALISDIHIAGNKTLTVNGGGELILDGCIIDSQSPGTPYTITTGVDGVLNMARNVVSDAIIDINTVSGSVPADVVSRVYDNNFASSDIEASADAVVYHNLLDATTAATSNSDATAAFDDVDGWGNLTDANLLENKFTLDFDAPVDPSRTLDVAGNLFVQTGDSVAMRLDVSALGSNGITAAEALLGYNSNMLTLTGAPTVVAPEGLWEVIAEDTSITPPSSLGMVDSALGLQLTSGQAGSTADATIARVDFTAANAGLTLGFFRVQNDRVFDGNGTLIKDTRLTKSVAGLPSYLAAFTANTGELVIDNEIPEILAAPITGIQVQPSQPAPVDVLSSAERVFRNGAPVTLTFAATDNGHGLSGLDAADVNNDLIVTASNGTTTLDSSNYSVTASDTGGVVTYTLVLNVPTGATTGTYAISATVQDRSGNVSVPTALGQFIIANEALVNVELQGFEGTTRDVTFVATGGVTTSWTKTITNFASGLGSVILSDVPAGTTSISAKTAWTLRSKVGASFTPEGVGSADLTGADKLKAGDITGDNVVNTLDYSVLRYNWLTSNTISDITGDGSTNGSDYTQMRLNFYTAGSAE